MKSFIAVEYDAEATMAFVNRYRESTDIPSIALKAARQPAVDREFALSQIAGYHRAVRKLPTWARNPELVYPAELSMEQCSSEQTAVLKASLVAGDTLLDLTGGFGVDCAYLSRGMKRAVMVERDARLCAIARHNFAALGYNNIEVVNGTAEENLAGTADVVYLDPARRGQRGQRVYNIADCTPDVVSLLPRLKAAARRALMIKLSPMFDLSRAVALLPGTTDVHIVAVGNECKELLIVMRRDRSCEGGVEVVCHNDGTCFAYDLSADYGSAPLYEGELTSPLYLYEPNAAIMNAGCFGAVAARYGVTALDANSHLFLSPERIEDFPGRSFAISEVVPFNKRASRSVAHLERANVAVRNFALNAAQLRARLRLADGGDTYLFGTSRGKTQLLIVTEKLNDKNDRI